MANEFKNKIIAVLLFLFALIFFYTLTYQLHFPETMGALFEDTVLKAAFWVGYILFIVTLLLIKPFLMISDDKNSQGLLGIFYGTGLFLAVSFGSMIIYTMLDAIFGIAFFQTMPFLNSIISFGFLIFAFVGMDIIPIYLVVRA